MATNIIFILKNHDDVKQGKSMKPYLSYCYIRYVDISFAPKIF